MKKVFKSLFIVALVFVIGCILTGCGKELGQSLKIDKNKELVYDAEYISNVKSESYETHFGETYYLKDIVVPYININSDYVSNVNNEIKGVFDEVITNYNEGVDTGLVYIDECNYKKYINNNALSVILTVGIGGTDIVNPDYYIYNIDVDEGTKLSYEDIYKLAGFNSSNINEKVNTAITNKMKEDLKNFEYYDGENFDTYNDISLGNYKDSLDNNTIKYFLSDNKLNIVVKLSTPAGTGSYNKIIEIN